MMMRFFSDFADVEKAIAEYGKKAKAVRCGAVSSCREKRERVSTEFKMENCLAP